MQLNDPRHELVDFAAGVPVASVPDGRALAGVFGEERLVLARVGSGYRAVGALCTHYGASLAGGIVVGHSIRCPLHHACFDLSTGAATAAPAFEPLTCWRVEQRGDMLFVREQVAVVEAPAPSLAAHALPSSIVIVGGGAAGFAAADTLRREGYAGPITMVSAEAAPPYDRSSLSKGFLTGEVNAEWMPLAGDDYYRARHIELVLANPVVSIDTSTRQVTLEDGRTLSYGALLLATGADPVRLAIPGADRPHVHYLRRSDDAERLLLAIGSARRVAIVGASFIGLETAAALRTRGLDVTVIGPESVPLERVFGPAIGEFVRRLHEQHGVRFHLGEGVAEVVADGVLLASGARIAADVVVMGVGVRPSLTLAQGAGLALDRGVVVDQYLETSASGVFAAGDIARWPDPHSGERIRVEHWAVAERQGQTAARNMLGRRQAYDVVPFFWTRQYGTSIRYVGHAERWDATEAEGTLNTEGPVSYRVTYRRGEQRLAVATIGRDRQSLEAEADMERGAAAIA